MPFIPNFPQSLLDEHMRWHHANHYDNPSQLPPGYGQNFLNFHRQFINKVYQWYNQQGYDPQQIAGWQSVPEAIRNTSCYNQAAEYRVLNNPRSFASADQLGLFLEGSNLHGCIHQEAARIFGEPALNDFDEAPRTTMFYNIHGMIDQWYRKWEQAAGITRNAGGKAFTGAARGRTGTSASPVKAKRGRIGGAMQKEPQESGSKSASMPVKHAAVRRGIRPYNKPTSAERNRKP